MSTTALNNYHALRKEIDVKTAELWKVHSCNMACKKGCDSCCLSFEVFPVEYAAIKEQLEKEYPQVLTSGVAPEAGEDCVFIKNNQCSIYNARPIICRTHGYPLLNMDEEGEEWELSFCELNFKTVDEDYFDEDNTYPQDTINSRLFMLNKDYLTELGDDNPDLFKLVPLKNLMSGTR